MSHSSLKAASVICADCKLWCSLQVLACVLLQPLGPSEDGTECGELAAFCVHPSYRGAGRGDSLLDYVEQQARDKGIRRLVKPCLVIAASCAVGPFPLCMGFPLMPSTSHWEGLGGCNFLALFL